MTEKILYRCIIQIFADDIICCMGDDINMVNNTLNDRMDNIYKWFSVNKTKFMLIQKKYSFSESPILMYLYIMSYHCMF